jgi:hypothetical protein
MCRGVSPACTTRTAGARGGQDSRFQGGSRNGSAARLWLNPVGYLVSSSASDQPMLCCNQKRTGNIPCCAAPYVVCPVRGSAEARQICIELQPQPQPAIQYTRLPHCQPPPATPATHAQAPAGGKRQTAGTGRRQSDPPPSFNHNKQLQKISPLTAAIKHRTGINSPDIRQQEI